MVAYQHDMGIPTWQDIENLDEEPTEDAIRSVLADSNTASAVMWLTPDIAESSMIRRVEAPLILGRHNSEDGFFVVPVAAGGLDYESVGAVLQGDIGIEDLRRWNIRRVSSNHASDHEIRSIANRILARRLEALHRHLSVGQPLDLTLNTRTRFAPDSPPALAVDWTHRFEDRIAKEETWRSYYAPSLGRSKRAGSAEGAREESASQWIALDTSSDRLGLLLHGPKKDGTSRGSNILRAGPLRCGHFKILA